MIKNYTSGVPVGRTISKIEEILVKGGADNIVKDYKDGVPHAICFVLNDPATKNRIAIRLPAEIEGVYRKLSSEVKRPRPGTIMRLKEQAARTAWKLIQDWVEVTMSRIQLDQSEYLQEFLSYIWDGKRTFFASLKDGGFKMLTDGK